METRRLMNAAMPGGLYWAQFGLYGWAAYAFMRSIIVDELSIWTMVFGLARVAAAYGLSNERKWGYSLGLAVCALTIIPTLNDLVQRPSLLIRGDFIILLIFPVAIVFSLLRPTCRDFVKTWFG
jgi:Predicted membrane protein (DUF2127)